MIQLNFEDIAAFSDNYCGKGLIILFAEMKQYFLRTFNICSIGYFFQSHLKQWDQYEGCEAYGEVRIIVIIRSYIDWPGIKF
jgi:hypothetical protein